MLHRSPFRNRSVPALVAPLLFACGRAPEPEVARAPEPEPEPIELAEPGPSPKDIKLAVEGETDRLTDCYMTGTFRDAGLRGTVNVTFTIQPSGRVSHAEDSGSDLGDPQVVDCVLGVFSSLEFTPGEYGATVVTYPVRFGRRS